MNLKTTGVNEINFKRQIKGNHQEAHKIHCFNQTRVQCTFYMGRLYEDLLPISLDPFESHEIDGTEAVYTQRYV